MKFFWRLKRDFKRLFHLYLIRNRNLHAQIQRSAGCAESFCACIHLQQFPNDLQTLGFQRFLVFLKKAKYDRIIRSKIFLEVKGRLSTFLSIAIIDELCDRRVTLFFHDGQITIVDLLGLISTFTLTQSSCIHLQQFPNSQKKLGISKVSGFPEKGKIRQVIDRANMTRAKTLSQIARLCPLCRGWLMAIGITDTNDQHSHGTICGYCVNLHCLVSLVKYPPIHHCQLSR
eukprot:sb/3469452/